MACTEAEAHERDVAFEARRATWRDSRSRRMVRRCSCCSQVKDLSRGFHRSKSEVGGRYYICKCCAIEKSVEYKRLRLADPAQKRKSNGAKKHYRAKLEVQARERAKRKRDWQALKADPEAYATEMEHRRLYYRLRQERAGREVTRTPKAQMSTTSLSYLPARPLVELLTRRIEQQRAISRVTGMLNENGEGEVLEICTKAGVTTRTYTRWRENDSSHVRIGVAERALLGLDVEWHEVYSFDDHAGQFLTTEAEVPA